MERSLCFVLANSFFKNCNRGTFCLLNNPSKIFQISEVDSQPIMCSSNSQEVVLFNTNSTSPSSNSSRLLHSLQYQPEQCDCCLRQTPTNLYQRLQSRSPYLIVGIIQQFNAETSTIAQIHLRYTTLPSPRKFCMTATSLIALIPYEKRQ